MKQKVFVTLFIILPFLCCQHIKAFDETVKIDNYAYKEGLTASVVISTYKDSKGFLWLCASNGLFRFDGYSFRNINTIVNGFLNSGTLCITEDNERNLWIGTSGKGLAFYNTHTQRLSYIKLSEGNNANVYKILFFKDKVWLATSIGLIVTDKPKNTTEKETLKVQVLLPEPAYKYLQANIINELYAEPGSNFIWVGTNSSLYKLNLTNLMMSRINSYGQNSIRSIVPYSNRIVVGSWDGGIFAVNPATSKLDNDFYIREINKVVGDKRVKTALFDNQNRCWVATFGEGLYVFEITRNGTVSYTNYRNDEKQANYLKSDFINRLYIDDTGIVWLSMNHPTLSKLYFQKSIINYHNFLKNSSDNKSKEILTVYPSSDKNKVWITTNGSGIFLFDIQTYEYKQFTTTSSGLQLQSSDISTCYQDKKGNLWIVYKRMGLYIVPSVDATKLISNKQQTTVHPIDANLLISRNRTANSYITKLYEDSKGRIWIGAWGSLSIAELKPAFSSARTTEDLLANCKISLIYIDFRKDRVSFPISPVLSIEEIEKHKVLVGTLDAGIIEFTETAPNVFKGKQLDISQKLPSTSVNQIYKSKAQDVWIATNAGLCLWNRKTNYFRTIGIKDGLSSEIINNIVEDNDHNIWISTSYGISRTNAKDFTVANFFYTDKEKINQYIASAAACSTDGTICFSTNEALVTLDPAMVENNTYQPPIYFTDVKIDNKTVIPGERFDGTDVIKTNLNESKTITVPYKHTLTLEFTALDFTTPERLVYKYRMGDKSEWITLNSNQRSLSLPNMKHGEYTLQVMLANSINNSQGRSITIIYLPPFWQSKPALVVYFGILLLAFLIYRRLTIQRMKQQSIIEKERYERKKLEELDKMKTEFFSNISHEFRTPLSLIINPLEKLSKDGELTDKNKKKVALILKSSNRLLKLTNELMDFSKLEKQLMVPEYQTEDIVSLTNEVCRAFSNMADTMSIDFRVNCSLESFPAPVDRKMIEKVIFNLLSNAFKFTPINGTILVNITKQTLEDGEYGKISVINTGEGIAKENLSRIFDRFYQVSNVQNRNVEGTGIGLSLVKSFVELHHGKVEVKSEPNLETCFDVYLPSIQNNISYPSLQNEPSAETTSLSIESHEDQSIKADAQYRILLVEDEDDIRNYIVDELSADFKISTARDGKEGIQMAGELIPDLVITDVMMPIISGIELCNHLKNQMITSHIPIIILSAKTSVDEQIMGLEMGADVYMVKPFSIDHLKTQIIRLISFKETIYSRYLKETTLLPKGGTATKLDEEFMKKVVGFIEKNLTNTDLNVDQLANCVALSKVQTYRKVKAISGQSIVEFIRTIRLKKAAELISERKLSFAEIAYETGFSSPSYFTKCFHDHFGKTPSEYATE